ncbi:MAG: hypothetical protein JW996_05280, partial [Candidatus Cloacimonetes bacterium]|nr:hypothetical protein [Candidatus Cloacimonadota bacterium]
MKKILILLTMIFLLLACSPSNENRSGKKLIDPRKPMAWGHPQTVYVFADNNVWKYAETPL